MALTVAQQVAVQFSLAYLGRPQDVGQLQLLAGSFATVDGFPAPTVAQQQALFSTAEAQGVFGATPTMSSVIAKSFELVGRTATAQNIADIVSWAVSANLTIAQLPWEIMKIALITEQNLPVANQIAWARLAGSYELAEQISGNPTIIQALASSASAQDSIRAIVQGITANTPAELAQFNTELAAAIAGGGLSATGQTFTLTISADAVTGSSGNDTINAITVNGQGAEATTLQVFDSINGGAGTDTLNIYVSAGENETQAGTVTNVEIINIINDGTGDINGGDATDASKYAVGCKKCPAAKSPALA